MYGKFMRIPLKCSASALNNNLSCFVEAPDKYRLAVIHKHLVNIITCTSKGESECRQLSFRSICDSTTALQPLILQAQWVTFDDRTIFIIVAQTGVQIFDSQGNSLLYWHSFLSPDADSCEETFGLGIASVGSSLLCIGSSEGTILVFQVPCEGQIFLTDTLKEHQCPVTSLCSNHSILASADDSGEICVWEENGNTVKKIYNLQNTGIPCTSLNIWKGILVASYAHGQIRVYDVTNGNIISDIDAHARAITAVDIAKDCGMVLSVSEDSYIHVWQLKQGNLPAVSHKFSENIPDCPLHGACFLGSSGSIFGISGYDMNEIICYRM